MNKALISKLSSFVFFKKLQAGFTLIEMLVVLLIIAILVAVAWPMYEKATEQTRVVQAEVVLRRMSDNISMALLEMADIYMPSVVFEGLPGENGDDLSWEDKHFRFSFDGTPVAVQAKGDYKLRLMSDPVKSVSAGVSEAPAKDGLWCFPMTEKGTSFCQAFSREETAQSCGAASCYLL